MANVSRISWIKKLTCLLVTMCVALSFGCRSEAAFAPQDVQALQGTGRICFVPLGAFPASTLESLAAQYRSKYGIPIEVLRPVQLDDSAVDSDRQQAVAESLITLMRRGHPRTASDPEVIMIGFTEEDMYIQRFNWRFAFTFRQENRFAVVSTGRMILGAVDNPELAEIRLRKMTTKNIGLLYFRLPPSDNPRSVLYRNVGGIQELDYMGEEF